MVLRQPQKAKGRLHMAQLAYSDFAPSTANAIRDAYPATCLLIKTLALPSRAFHTRSVLRLLLAITATPFAFGQSL